MCYLQSILKMFKNCLSGYFFVKSIKFFFCTKVLKFVYINTKSKSSLKTVDYPRCEPHERKYLFTVDNTLKSIIS